MILSFGPFGSSAQWAHGASSGWLWWTGSSALALLAYLAAAAPSVRAGTRMRAALVLAWLAHAAAMALDIAGVGMAPGSDVARFGFAPALSVTVWLVLGVYLIESRFLPLSGVRRSLALLGAAAVALAWLFPGELRPLASSRWLPLHWVLGIASYGLFGAAVLHAALLDRAERRMRRRSAAGATAAGGLPEWGLPLVPLERLTYRFVAWGFGVLSAALLLGWWFADPWRWDHKTVFSMLGWLVFAGLLAGRRAFGWRGPLATRWLFAGAALLLLAYVGSRFVLEVLLQRPVA